MIRSIFIKSNYIHTRSILVILFLILWGSSFIGADDQTPQLDSIHIEGLRRTKEEVVLDLVALRQGDNLTPPIAEEIEDRLIKSGLFASVEVTIVDSGKPSDADLLIKVDEKWTLVPIPFFATGGDGFSGGLILLESNLFGRNKQLVSAGFGGTEGFSGFFLYSDPAVWGSRWSASLSAGSGRSETETRLPDGDLIRGMTLVSNSAGLGAGYRISPATRVRMRLSVATWDIEEWKPGIDDKPVENGSTLEHETSFRFETTRPLDVLLVGPDTRAAVRFVFPDNGWEASGRILWGLPVFETHRVRLLTEGGYGEMPLMSESSISSRDGFRTLPYQATRADSWASASAFYDFPLISAGWGALVLSHYWEAGIYDTELLNPQPFYGPGGGFRVYIRQIAIPALGLDLAYNLNSRELVFSFALGARM